MLGKLIGISFSILMMVMRMIMNLEMLITWGIMSVMFSLYYS